MPIYLLAAVWDYLASKQNSNDAQRKALTFSQAWRKQTGKPLEEKVQLNGTEPKASHDWEVERADYFIECYKKEHLAQAKVGSATAKTKAERLSCLQRDLRTLNADIPLEILIQNECNYTSIHNKHRFFSTKRTATTEFLDNLRERVSPPAA